MIKLDFKGGKELEAAIGELGLTAAKGVARRALKKAATPIQAAWSAMAPKLSGDLKESIAIGTKLTRRQARENRRSSPSNVEMHIGTKNPAGVQTEFGNAHQRAQPAARPAWDREGGQAALDRIGKELAVETEKAAARARRRALKGR